MQKENTKAVKSSYGGDKTPGVIDISFFLSQGLVNMINTAEDGHDRLMGESLKRPPQLIALQRDNVFDNLPLYVMHFSVFVNCYSLVFLSTWILTFLWWKSKR